MKIKSLLIVALVAIAANSFGQYSYSGAHYAPNVITTAVPFLSIAPNAHLVGQINIFSGIVVHRIDVSFGSHTAIAHSTATSIDSGC